MKYRLKDIFDLQMGKTPARNNDDYWNTEDYKWISIADLSKAGKYISKTKEHLSKTAIDDSGIKVIPANTVVMSFKLSIGKVAITSENMYSNEAIMAFHDKHVIDMLPEYIFYMFMYKKWDEVGNKAVMGKTLNKAILSNVEIDICPVEEQRNIVKKLDKMMNILEYRKRELESLDDIIKARFVEMFGDPVINPKEWEECTLSEKINVLGGYAFKSEEFNEEDGIPVLRIGNINSGYFKPTNLVYWPEDEKLRRYVVYPGDLVMSLTGTVGKDDYGNVCILRDDFKMYYLNQRNAKLEIKDGINQYYLSELLEFKQIKKKLTGINRGVRQANISNKDILNLIVPIPPIELQNQFADFVHQVDKSKVISENQLKNIAILLTICSTIYINMNGKMGRVLYDN